LGIFPKNLPFPLLVLFVRSFGAASSSFSTFFLYLDTDKSSLHPDLMARSIFIAALLAVSALAIPLKNACDPARATLTVPAGLAAPVGAPSAVLLGVGVQNYTCTDAGTYA
jgi:hypothetical protein